MSDSSYEQLYMQGWTVGVTLSERDIPEGPQAQKDVYRIGHSDGIMDREVVIGEAKRYSDLYTTPDERTLETGDPTLTVNSAHSDESGTVTIVAGSGLQSVYDVPGSTIEIDPLAVTIDPTKMIPLVITLANGDELFVIQPNGAVYVRGELTVNDADIVQGLRDAVKEMTS